MMLFSTMWIMLLANKPDFSLLMAVDFEGSNRGDSFQMNLCNAESHELNCWQYFHGLHTHTHKWLILSPSVLPLKTEAKAKQQEMDFDSSCEVNNIKVKCIRVIVIVMFKDKIILFQFYRENTMNCNRVFFSQPFSVFFIVL
jgi:hypothetical protein